MEFFDMNATAGLKGLGTEEQSKYVIETSNYDCCVTSNGRIQLTDKRGLHFIYGINILH